MIANFILAGCENGRLSLSLVIRTLDTQHTYIILTLNHLLPRR